MTNCSVVLPTFFISIFLPMSKKVDFCMTKFLAKYDKNHYIEKEYYTIGARYIQGN